MFVRDAHRNAFCNPFGTVVCYTVCRTAVKEDRTMWINSPLGRWEMKERTKRAPGQEQLGRWLREVEDAKRAQEPPRSASALTGIALTLRDWFGLRSARRTA